MFEGMPSSGRESKLERSISMEKLELRVTFGLSTPMERICWLPYHTEEKASVACQLWSASSYREMDKSEVEEAPLTEESVEVENEV